MWPHMSHPSHRIYKAWMLLLCAPSCNFRWVVFCLHNRLIWRWWTLCFCKNKWSERGWSRGHVHDWFEVLICSQAASTSKNCMKKASRIGRLFVERETRLELATPTLARLCSTNWAILACVLFPLKQSRLQNYTRHSFAPKHSPKIFGFALNFRCLRNELLGALGFEWREFGFASRQLHRRRCERRSV